MRPSITLCCIMRDEMSHIKDLLSSVKGCFDEIHLTDTGSVDGTIEFAQSKEAEELAGCPVKVKHFKWCDDFAAARNYSFEGVTTDYVMWMDLDDKMSSREQFIKWRDNVMMLSDFWLAPYHYAFNEKGEPICTFIRERVIKTSRSFKWQYAIHEGMIANEPVKAEFVNNWVILHNRTKEDYEKDYSRNVSMLEKMAEEGELPTRLKFYFGKELFDKGRYPEAYVWLNQIVDKKDLEQHDRILTFEYLIRSCLQRFMNEESHKPQKNMELLAKALGFAMQAVALAPKRAEFYCLAGDALIQMGRDTDALPLYNAAKECKRPGANDASFIFSNSQAYEHIPYNMVASIKFKIGDLDGAIADAKAAVEKFGHKESEDLLSRFLDIQEKLKLNENPNKIKTDEIVFSCIPNSHPYEFDEEIYKTKGVGGSETALIEVAKRIKEKTSRRVIVFNSRSEDKVCESGVEYISSDKMLDYFNKVTPGAHIAWRHNVQLTKAPTYLWCHDLFTAQAEKHEHFVKHICLTEFHKDYVQVKQGIPDHKIMISRNGVNKSRFAGDAVKNENKIIFPSSPDRGLIQAIQIVEKARAKKPNLELHVYYGYENMKKAGGQMAQLAAYIEKMIEERPWVKYHGNVDQKTLAEEMKEAVVWLYPATFIESYCITAVESIYAKCMPVVRNIGALKNTVKPFVDRGWAKMLFLDVHSEEDQEKWSNELIDALESRAWERIDTSDLDYSWDGVARQFMDEMGIDEDKITPKELGGEVRI